MRGAVLGKACSGACAGGGSRGRRDPGRRLGLGRRGGRAWRLRQRRGGQLKHQLLPVGRVAQPGIRAPLGGGLQGQTGGAPRGPGELGGDADPVAVDLHGPEELVLPRLALRQVRLADLDPLREAAQADLVGIQVVTAGDVPGHGDGVRVPGLTGDAEGLVGLEELLGRRGDAGRGGEADQGRKAQQTGEPGDQALCAVHVWTH